MPVTIEDVMEAAAVGVLRALDARRKGSEGPEGATGAATEDLVRSGFNCGVHIICGGIPAADPFGGGGRTPAE
jgi:hypothetical protein